MIAKSHHRTIPGCCWANRIACDYESSLKTFFLAFKRMANGLGRVHYSFQYWLEPVNGWADETSCQQLECNFILILYKSLPWLILTVMPCIPVTGTPSITLIFNLQSVFLIKQSEALL